MNGKYLLFFHEYEFVYLLKKLKVIQTEIYCGFATLSNIKYFLEKKFKVQFSLTVAANQTFNALVDDLLVDK